MSNSTNELIKFGELDALKLQHDILTEAIEYEYANDRAHTKHYRTLVKRRHMIKVAIWYLERLRRKVNHGLA